jgi:hypothetical protein
VRLMLHSKQVQVVEGRALYYYYRMLPWTLEGAVQVQASTTAAPKPRCNHGMRHTVSPNAFATTSAAHVRIREVLGWHLTK